MQYRSILYLCWQRLQCPAMCRTCLDWCEGWISDVREILGDDPVNVPPEQKRM